MGDSVGRKDEVVALGSRLAADEPIRRGTLTERYVKCSKPGCGCATDPKQRHGPYYSLTRKVGGKTQSRLLSKEQAAVVQRQVESGQRFRERVEEYWRAAEAWADSALVVDSDASTDADGKKNASRRPSMGKLRRKSRS